MQIEVAKALNAVLAQKPHVLVQSTQSVMKQVRSGGRGGRNGADPSFDTVVVQVPVNVAVPATVSATRILEVGNVAFGPVVSSDLPEQVRISRRVIENDSAATFSSSITSSAAATETWNVTKTRGVTVTNG